jgi:hypothetical protein
MGGCAGPLDPATRPIVATGNGQEPSASTSTNGETGTGGIVSKGGFYPLQIGNRWTHRREQVIRIVPNDGENLPVATSVSETQREILCAQSFGGVPYVVERATEYGTSGTYLAWNFYRQSTTGLYELDILGTDPPPCQGAAVNGPRQSAAPVLIDERVIADLVAARPVPERAAYQVALRRLHERMTALDIIRRPPEPAMPGELTRLRYPLERKLRWVVRDDPNFRLTAVVDGADVLDLPPGRLRGFRIRFETDRLGPADVILFWYGRQGYLQFVGHAEVDAVDNQGIVIGRAVLDERDALVDLSLASSEIVALPPWR